MDLLQQMVKELTASHALLERIATLQMAQMFLELLRVRKILKLVRQDTTVKPPTYAV
jgi:hypothetical protein